MNEIHPIQAMINGMSAQWEKDRAETQLTLGKLIAVLETMPPDTQVANLCKEHSYRGYYSDLAFETHDGTRPAADLLADCRKAMGRVYEGYKGGDFPMHANTPLWVAYYGSCGEKLMSVSAGGGIETAPDEY